MICVLLAAGFATRLWPLTRDRAKPLLEVGGAPILTHLVRKVHAAGAVERVVVVTNGRFHADFEAWRAELPKELSPELVCDGVQEPDARLGAVGDLALALEGSASDDGYLVMAGDNLFDETLAPMCARLAATGRGQLLMRAIEGPVPSGKYNAVEVDGEGRVLSMREKPERHTAPWASIPTYGLPSDLPQLVEEYRAEGGEGDAPGYLIEWLVARRPFDARPMAGRWFDIGGHEELAAARAAFVEGERA